ncbi:MAG: N-acetylmuramoyl-L-alanine amidase [Saprospiraceae bacterium]
MKNSLSLSFFALLMMMISVGVFGQSKNSLEYNVKFTSTQLYATSYSKKITIESPLSSPFVMLSGFVGKENFGGQYYFRTQIDENSEWSEWQLIPVMTEGITPNRTVYFGGEIDPRTKYLNLKSITTTPTDFNLRLFFPGHSDENNTVHARGGEADCTCEQPDICGRACWCPSGDCPIDTTPESTVASHFIVHHSAGQTTSSDFAAVVRSYYDLHTSTNGWDDIGYNWLIDGNGVIYEGRGQGLQGAHFSCMNENTIGICVIGNYENATPTSEAINALQNFIAWGSCEEDIDVLGMDLHPSSTFNLNNISGHLDGNDSPNACSSTVCPGVNLYGLLPTIRDEIAALPCINDNSSNVNELLENEKIEVFPNPNDGNFQVNFENVEITNIVIYNSIGQQIENDNNTITNYFFQNKTVKIATNGLYHLQFHLNDGRVISQKVVVTK